PHRFAERAAPAHLAQRALRAAARAGAVGHVARGLLAPPALGGPGATAGGPAPATASAAERAPGPTGGHHVASRVPSVERQLAGVGTAQDAAAARRAGVCSLPGGRAAAGARDSDGGIANWLEHGGQDHFYAHTGRECPAGPDHSHVPSHGLPRPFLPGAHQPQLGRQLAHGQKLLPGRSRNDAATNVGLRRGPRQLLTAAG
nr:hypothetical protein [Tanacetum cinerariifolium]